MTSVVENDPKIVDLSCGDHYTDNFGVEWTNYPDVQRDSFVNNHNLSLRRLQLVLGFPIRYLANEVVLEIGCGPGRFSEYLADTSRHLCLVDSSQAIYCNPAVKKDNVCAIRGDFLKDRVECHFVRRPTVAFCRGVLQHLPDPAAGIRRLFDFVPPGGVVVFDIYPKYKPVWLARLIEFKYFWRMVLPKVINAQDMVVILENHGAVIKKIWDIFRSLEHNRLFRILRKICPFFGIFVPWEVDKHYPGYTGDQLQKVFNATFIDGFYADFDTPKTFKEVLDILGSIGQYPYSFDASKCIFRCVKQISDPFDPLVTKNGVFGDQAVQE